MRVLVVGGTGLVGNALARTWARRGAQVAAATYHCHPSPEFRQLDIEDEAAVRAIVADTRPEIVAVPAANPHVDYCELHPEETRRVNVAGTLNVARSCRRAGVPMIFFSSDYVFDGLKDVYTEEDPVTPINEYGRQKAEAEAGVLAEDSRNLVVRTAGAYGWQWEPKNFVLQIRGRLGGGQAMKIASDVRYNPTPVENLAEIVADLAQASSSGIYNVVGADRIGRYEFALKVAETFGLDPSLLEPVASAHFRAPALRPPSSSLSTEKVRRVAATALWGVREGLDHMKESEASWRQYAERLPSVSRSV